MHPHPDSSQIEALIQSGNINRIDLTDELYFTVYSQYKSPSIELCTGSDAVIRKYKNYEDFDMDAANILYTIEEHTGFNWSDHIEGWNPVEDSDGYKWETPVNNNEVSISQTNLNPWKVQRPEYQSRYNGSFTRKKDAYYTMILYLYENNGWQIDYKKTIEEVAKEEFQKISGIGRSTARDLVSAQILSFKTLKERPYKIERQYKSEALDDIETRLEMKPDIPDMDAVTRITEERTIDII